jgi:hypothetical protein
MASEGWDVIEGAVATEQWTKRESLTQMEKTKKPWPVANTRCHQYNYLGYSMRIREK